MKSLKLFLLLFIILSVSVASGCKSGDNSQEAELGKQIEELRKQVDDLKNGQAIPPADNIEDAGTVQQSADVKPIATNAVSDTVESLSKEVDKITAKVDSATIPKDQNEKRTNFYALKDELDLVEDRIDAYDDYIESQQKQGNLSYDDYKNQERQLDDLEDRLDASEDKLERNFGIYD
ncbi:MAG: hypothetical protein HFJ09_06980 [Lachnospiraceae bacterium]|nr:hypothetical protein [Lachnospiraceae bacterium]